MKTGQRNSSRTLVVSTTTWRRESHGLFDYETGHVARANFNVESSGQIVRSGDDCLFLTDPSDRLLHEELKTLAYIEQGLDEYTITPESESHWLIVRRDRSGALGFRLVEGDVVKLGRVRFKVKEIYNPFVTLAMQTNMSMDYRQRSSLSPSKDEGAPQAEMTAGAPCRICLMETYTKANPLMTPCKCSGTMRFIHLLCLQQWLGSKMTMRQSGNTVSYSWKHLECELCKEPFPLVVSLEGKVVELVEMHKPDTPYLILEDERVDPTRGRGLHVISLLENSSVRMGRGHESDLRISDISVSRCHAIIQLTREGFFITDNRSKFGTLLLARRPVHVRDYDPISIQVNRTVVMFRLKEPWKFVKSCLTCACCCRGRSSVSDEPIVRTNSEIHEDEAAVIAVAEAINPTDLSPFPRASDGLQSDTHPLEDLHPREDLRTAAHARAATTHLEEEEPDEPEGV